MRWKESWRWKRAKPSLLYHTLVTNQFLERGALRIFGDVGVFRYAINYFFNNAGLAEIRRVRVG